MTASTQPAPSHISQRAAGFAPLLQALFPTGVGIAFLYWVGLWRNDSYYSYFRMNADIAGLTPLENVKQSAAAMLSVCIAASLVALFHSAAVAVAAIFASSSMGKFWHRTIVFAIAALLIISVVTLVSIGLTNSYRFSGLAFPIAAGMGASISFIAIRRYVSPTVFNALTGHVSPRTFQNIRVATWLILAATIVTATLNYASGLGAKDAMKTASELSRAPTATLYAKQGLSFTLAPGLVENRVPPSAAGAAEGGASTDQPRNDSASQREKRDSSPPDDDNAYKFQYVGFRVLLRTADRWYFVPETWKPAESKVYVLPDNDDIRVELGG